MPAEKTSFYDVLQAEACAVNARRQFFAGTRRDRGEASLQTRSVRVMSTGQDERGETLAQPAADSELVGLSLSGGGIRSAAFCLGVLQGLDAVVDDGKPQLLDAVDYLSTVSGGGYIGASLASGMTQEQGRFPFASKLDEAEPVEVQHLRDYSNYLAPGGVLDLLVDLVVVVRGLLVNAVILLSLVFLFAFVTVLVNRSESDLRRPLVDAPFGSFHSPFTWTIVFALAFAVSQFVYAVLANRPRERNRTTLRQRESTGTVFVWLLLACGVVVFLELQAFVLVGLFDAAHLEQSPAYAPSAGWLGSLLAHFVVGNGTFWASLTAAVGMFGAFGSKLLKVAQATLGDKTWGGVLKHWLSRAAIYAGGIVVPLALWAVYLFFAYVGIGWEGLEQPCRPDLPVPACSMVSHMPGWLTALAAPLGQHVWLAYLILFFVLFFVSLFVTPNAGSLHGFYRDRLSRAFIWDRSALERRAAPHEEAPSRILQNLRGLRAGPSATAGVDETKLSLLKPAERLDGPNGPVWRFTEAVRYAPYLLMNTAVNLEASEYLNRRGRNADSFFFSPLYTGSAATGYVDTPALEACDGHIDLATAMAISGAAASANMGASTIRPLIFSLAVLNIRLGYWLPNPRMVPRYKGWMRALAQVGPWYFSKEALGLLDEWTSNVYLTDGGHFDNLGLYELLKRRCKTIIAVDAEADPPMNFESLIRLQRYARIDLGVRIDLPWEELRQFSKTITIDSPHGPSGKAADCIGPHIALGKIEYGKEEAGVLIYIKSCISGDENDLIRDYRRRNNDFPHETTLDQFFTEEQFEVYRALGFHATQSFFFGKDRFAALSGPPGDQWVEQVRSALQRLNVPGDAIDKIVARQRSFSTPPPARSTPASACATMPLTRT